MAYKIKLKIRKTSSTISAPVPIMLGMLNLPNEEEAKDALWEYFAPVKETQKATTHDGQWLQSIVDWTPEGGLPLSEMAKWFKLAEHVNQIDEEKEKQFTFSQFQADLIWSRITDDKFKMVRLDIAFVEFIKEFQSVTGKHFAQEEPPDEPTEKDA